MQGWGDHSQPPLGPRGRSSPAPGRQGRIQKHAMLEYFPEQGSLSSDVSLSPQWSQLPPWAGLPNTSLVEGSLALGDSRCHRLK